MHEVEAVQVFMILGGIACGLVGTAYPLVLFRGAIKDGTKSDVSIGSGLVAVLASFLFLSLIELLLYLFAEDQVLQFAGPMLISYLSVWAVGAVWAWKSANSDSNKPVMLQGMLANPLEGPGREVSPIERKGRK